ncbi:hypothetical protein V6R21_06265 [Limibacter armeniacum]|uniref:hypothetical protein n=1 Tax=Limibacter armeniacum TaxID=466084 RepID=UPI002FE5A9E8
MADITTTDLVAQYGTYYDGKDKRDRLYELVRVKSETDMVASSITIEENEYQAAESEFTEILQGFQKGWTPKGALTFKPRPIKLGNFKIDVEVFPDDLKNTWAEFLTGLEPAERTQWPLVRWMLEKHIMPKIQEDWELKEVFGGVKTAINAGTPSAAGANIDGLRKQINDGITAGDITPIATGAAATDPVAFVDQIEAFVDAIPQEYRDKPMELVMSKDLAKRYARGYRAKYMTGVVVGGESRLEVVDTNITIVGVPSMIGSEKWFCTLKWNLKKIMRNKGNFNSPQVTKGENPRGVQIYSDWWMSIGFLIPEIVFTNDQDTL